jgi:hypothetical protein
VEPVHRAIPAPETWPPILEPELSPMGILALVVAIVLSVAGYRTARAFTFERLRYTPVGEHPGASGLVAGLGAALLAAPLVALLPVVGAGTAIALGAGVGTGVVAGTRGRLGDEG